MPLTGPETVTYECDPETKVATITLNRPERANALNGETFRRFSEVFHQFNHDDDAWSAVVTGAGERHFCAGADLKELAESTAGGGRREPPPLQPQGWLFTPHMHVWKPVIAAINGAAAAGGWLLAQRCDIRIASEDAKLGITETKWNLPASWVTDLSRIIGLGHALELVLTSDFISAQRAYEIGFVNQVVPHDQVKDAARELAVRINRNGPLSCRAHKEILYRGCELTREQGETLGNTILFQMMNSEDFLEGSTAFARGVTPQWKGR